jgi:transcriptional regulator with XRE-family HTH domain
MLKPREFATNLALIRRQRGHTLDELAVAVASDSSTLSRAERGILRPPRVTLNALADALGVSAADLLCPPDEQPAPDPAAALEAVR